MSARFVTLTRAYGSSHIASSAYQKMAHLGFTILYEKFKI